MEEALVKRIMPNSLEAELNTGIRIDICRC